jgi:2-polyprenyl-6-hydroxyphenyl methylase/3-demethylubiquinone-9 3-methyltransferase
VSAPCPTPACKVCGGATAPFGEADANRSCEDRDGFAPFPPAGRAVRYLLCAACGFAFTTDFDALTDAEMGAAIYNADYIKADPEFAAARPDALAEGLALALAPFPGLRLLDYGGGAGRMAEGLRARGFSARVFDPFFAHEALPEGERFPLVTAFEVAEHSRDPLATFREALGFLEPGGALLFSTALRPEGAGMEWHYAAPRNGHVSLHTGRSLDAAARRLGGWRRLTLAEGLHLFAPAAGANAVARHLVRRAAGGVLYDASRRGPAAYADAWARVARTDGAASWRRLLDPRHAARALASLAVSGIRAARHPVTGAAPHAEPGHR